MDRGQGAACEPCAKPDGRPSACVIRIGRPRTLSGNSPGRCPVSEPEPLEYFARPLHQLGGRYLVAGSLGAMLYSEPSPTLDIAISPWCWLPSRGDMGFGGLLAGVPARASRMPALPGPDGAGERIATYYCFAHARRVVWLGLRSGWARLGEALPVAPPAAGVRYGFGAQKKGRPEAPFC